MTCDRGFSLLELIAVLSIFAMVALVGVQVLQVSIHNHDRLSEVSDQSKDLAVGLSLLRQDLNSAIPIAFVNASGTREPALSASPNGFALSVGGLARLADGTTGFGRVVWQHNPTTSQLSRQVWTSLDGIGPSSSTQVIFKDVTRFEIQQFANGVGWVPWRQAPRDMTKLPLGLKVSLDLGTRNNIETVVSLR